MKRHTRFWSIMLTAFLLVGLFAGMAAAASKQTVTVTASPSKITVQKGKTATVTLSGEWSSGSGVTAKTVTATTSDAEVFTVSPASVAFNANTVTSGTFTITGVAVGKETLTLTDATPTSITVEVTEASTSTTPAAPVFDDATSADKTDLGKAFDETNGGFFAGETMPTYEFTADCVNGTNVIVEATFSPSDKSITSMFTKGTKGDSSTATFGGGTVPAVTKDTKYTMKVTATDSNKKPVSRTYTFTIFADPAFDANTQPSANIVWGSSKTWSFTPKATNADEIAFVDSEDVEGIEFSDGKFTATGWKGQFPENWDGKNITGTVTVRAKRGTAVEDIIEADSDDQVAVAVDKTYTITYEGSVPTIKFDASKLRFAYGEEISEDAYVIIDGPGVITVKAEDLPAGVSFDEFADYSSDPDNPTAKAWTFTGTPEVSTKGTAVKITASNPYSKKIAKKDVTVSPKIVITATEVTMGGMLEDLPGYEAASDQIANYLAKADEFNVTLSAEPAPIKWKATNLPAGLTLTPDKKDSTKAVLKGKLTTATKDPSSPKNIYTITATNADFSSATPAVFSRDIVVWEKPEFKTDSKKSISVKTGENGIKFTIDTKSPVMSWDVVIDAGETPVTITSSDGYFIPKDDETITEDGTSMILINEAKSKNTSLAFTGSFDRVPNAEIPLKVTVKTPAASNNEAEATFKIKVNGVAPKFSAGNFEFKTGDTASYDISKGDPDVIMTAEIDATTMQKLTGDKKAKAVTLSDTPDSLTGITFVPNDKNNGTSVFGFTTPASGDVAFKKLPVTVSSYNPNINKDKPTKSKVTITVEGDAPAWEIGTFGAELHPADEDTTYAEGNNIKDEYDGKLLLKVQGGEDFTDGLIVVANGAGPLTVTVKPLEKNGIKATLGDDGRTVTFSGKPDGADKVKKDTAVKFTLEAKNNSTGNKDKADITFTIVPDPTLDSNSATITPKAVEWGKNVKIAPKLAATNKNLTWLITAIGDDTYDEDKREDAATALEVYGFELDEAKGTISGKAAYTTGTDDPIVVKMKASGDFAQSAEVTATITVVGEKVKLATKSVTLTDLAGTETPADDLKLETNISDAEEPHRADVTWTLGTLPTEVKGLTLTDNTDPDGNGNVGLTATLVPDELKVAKKVTVPVTFKNYGTTTTDKLSISIEGAMPVIGDDDTIAVKAGDTKGSELKLEVTNAENVSSKLKWKISTRPDATGVTASIKADSKNPAKAVLTVKASNKASSGSPTVGIIVTDSGSPTKNETEEYTVTISVESDDASALNATDDNAALESEAKVIGEGKVTMGVQRTVENLTAGQRAQIEAQGYVIAAVLPEIEVDADGQYDFEVELDADEKVKAGAELVWFAFASKPTTDDEIVDFEDLEGNEIKVVPAIAEGHEYPVVVAWPWLNEGTKYAPVIAVKATASEADAMTEDGVKEKAEEAKEEK